jgi:hypothetical protein
MAAKARGASTTELKAMVQQLRGAGLIASDAIKLTGAGRNGEVIRGELLEALAALVQSRVA